MTPPIAVEEVIGILAPLVRGGGTIGADTPLLSSGLIDSFAVAELMGALEERFGVELELEQFVVELANTPAMIARVLSRQR
jgi:acyl carrier protein